ncbi:cytochrome c551 [Domibacillus mangrovi]|uniref:Cytochrome C551 n=1 Tax=Domibacillus mangrovi TaxID=1714354 RepID=A0A1Q5P2P6_9BACI|nr:cytochrome c [Domibacillus mangrovi]OKL36443.1 cytochrome C551 [Domibacillus mangrovi]
MKKSLLALILGSSVALAACGGGNDAAKDTEKAVDEVEQNTENAVDETEQKTENGVGETTTSAAGEEVYKQSCLSCHGGNLEGGFGPALDKVGAKYSKDEILDIIHNGKGQMPANVAEGADAEAVASWLAEKK